MEVKQNDADLIDTVIHASDGEGVVHLSKLLVRPLLQFFGHGDQTGGSRLLEGVDNGENPVREVIAGVAREVDLVEGERVGNDVVGAEVDEAMGGHKDGDLLTTRGEGWVGHELLM
jgi:hypothetical protein